ncbi:MAG TPA: methyltransferase domain-containing protein [Chloroflexi bacterium]|nr:methyltransferase domain-containing protein [Chloroflexota bacterium]
MAPDLTLSEWDDWFTVQAGWTRSTRTWIYSQAALARADGVLDVGCGTGAITGELRRWGAGRVVGVDVDARMLTFAREREDGVTYVHGDAHHLPFPDHSFDVVLSHFLLLWLTNPIQGVCEMARVLRPGGYVAACAEPDYGGRVDYPPALASLGRWQAEALRRQGAEPEMGRRLGELFAGAGLQTTVGVMAGRWDCVGNDAAPPGGDFDTEWSMRQRDLAGLVPPEKLRRWREIDRQALAEGRRVLFVPTFYALGQKVKRER